MKGTKGMNTIGIIEEVSFDETFYDIAVGQDDGSDPAIVARCWDFHLAKKIRDAVEEYMFPKAES